MVINVLLQVLDKSTLRARAGWFCAPFAALLAPSALSLPLGRIHPPKVQRGFGGEFLALLSRAKSPVCEMRRAGWHLRPGCRAWRGAEARVRLVVPPQPLEHLVGNTKPWIVFKKIALGENQTRRVD